MGLHNTAHYLKSHGRGEDTELVHMTKGEVKGLEDLARAKGGILSINPSTGLKEAGFLSDILPTVVGAGVGIMTGNPMLGAAAAGGLSYGTNGGNLNKSIMSGLGAYGGAGLYSGLSGAGAATLGAEVSPIAAEAGTQALLNSGVEVGKSVVTPQEIGALVNSGALTKAEAEAYGNAYSGAFAKIGGTDTLMAGLKSPGALSNNLGPLSMLGVSALGAFGNQSQNSISSNPNPGYIRPYTFSQTRNPNYGQPGQPYFNQKYTAQTVVPANQWGSQSLPTSGMAGGGLAENQMYPQSYQDSTQFATPTQMPTSAEVMQSDYDPRVDAYTGQATGFAGGGMLAFDEGGDVPQAWNPESGQVKLQQPMDPRDPNSEMRSTDYTIPKDQIKTFIPNMDQETGIPNGSGAYVLKDGSTLGVDNFGVVSAATPGRNDYTLNKEGYYQPTGANLNWDGSANMLTKKIGGVDVMVPNEFHKGGYQDAKGNLRVNEEGVPIPLLPNYLDSGVGKSGLADAAPYIALAAMTAATMGAGATGFAGMVPASETLLGAAGAGALGGTAGLSSADLGLTPYIASTGGEGALGTTAGLSTADLGTSPYIANQGAPIYDFSTPYSGALNPSAFQSPSLIPSSTLGKVGLASAGASALGMNPMSMGGGSSGSAPATTANYPQVGIAPRYNYDPRTQGYTQRAAAGGIMHGNLGGYSDGGRLLKGPGDGVSDSIPAKIGEKQPARLADGEFVVPARIVSELGNGSTEAGARQLYKMMDRIQAKRRKSKAIAANTKAFKDLPA